MILDFWSNSDQKSKIITGRSIGPVGGPGSAATQGRPHTVADVIKKCLIALSAGVLVASGGAIAAAAPPVAPPALQASLDKLAADGVPGAIALERQGDQVWHAAAGVRNLQTGDPIQATDRFRIGSNTKSFISTVILQFEAEHRLRITDSVEQWLPGLVPNGRNITIRELLNHTSGIPDYVDLDFFLGLIHHRDTTYQPRDLVRRAVAQPPVFPPGTSWSYSNTNYILLGLIIARVDHRPEPYAPVWEVYRRIIGPLGLTRTTFPITDPNIAGPHPHGYFVDPPAEFQLPGTTDMTRSNPSWAWTAGAIISTTDDLARFHRALFTGQLLPPAQQHELLSTVPTSTGNDYGLGVLRAETPCGDAWGFEGAFPGYESTSLSSLDGTRQAVLLLNRDANSDTDQILDDEGNALITAFCETAVAG
jgi:D-alanyl-D-alanine carboxypeptidase